MAAELEAKAAALRLEALQHITIALAGVNCRELFTLLVTFFGKNTRIDPFSFLEGAPKISPPLELTDTESEADAEIDAEAGGDAEGDSDVVASTSTATTSAPTESRSPRLLPWIQILDLLHQRVHWNPLLNMST